MRRRSPHRLISWTRLLAGDWRDPLVGRDVLFAAGVITALAVYGFRVSLAGRSLFRQGLLED